MGATNHTPNIELPQFVDADKPTWRGDVNGAFTDIDAKFGEVDGNLATKTTAAAALEAAAGLISTQHTADDTEYNNLYGKITEAPLSPYRYGYVADPTVNNSAAIQATIDAASAVSGTLSRGGEVRFPQGTIKADGILWRTGVKGYGWGRNSTVFQAPSGSANKAVFMIPNNTINSFVMEDFSLMGNGNAGQHGMWFQTVTGVSGTGVFDEGAIRRVSIGDTVRKFAGHCLWLAGGGGTFVDPIQWTVLDQVQCYPSTTGKGMVFSGQVGQTVVINGFANGPGMDTPYTLYGGGSNVYVGPELNSAGAYVSATSPYSVTFINFSCQSNGVAMDFQGGGGYTIVGGHFEDNAVSVHSAEPTVNLSGGNFGNGAHNTAGTGCLLRTSGSGRIVATGITSIGTVDKHYDGDVHSINCGIGFDVQPITTNNTFQLGVLSGGIIHTHGYQTVLVNTSTTHINTINSELGVGESLFLKATGGSIIFDWGGTAPGAVHSSGLTFPLTVPAFAIVHLIRMDLGANWCIVSVTA